VRWCRGSAAGAAFFFGQVLGGGGRWGRAAVADDGNSKARSLTTTAPARLLVGPSEAAGCAPLPVHEKVKVEELSKPSGPIDGVQQSLFWPKGHGSVRLGGAITVPIRGVNLQQAARARCWTAMAASGRQGSAGSMWLLAEAFDYQCNRNQSAAGRSHNVRTGWRLISCHPISLVLSEPVSKP
jgi:hypothetical protein